MIKVHIDRAKGSAYDAFEVESEFKLVQSYLYSDIQTAHSARAQIAQLRGVMAGTESPEEATGNGWAVMPGATTSRVENMYTEKGIDVPTVDLIAILEQWCAYLVETQGDI